MVAIKRTLVSDGDKRVLKLTLPRAVGDPRTVYIVTDGIKFKDYKTEAVALRHYAEL